MTRQPLIVRRLGSADVAHLRRLNLVFADAFADFKNYADEPPSEIYLKELLAKDHVIAIVALSGDEVLGGLVAYELDKSETARREVYIYDLAVRAEHRRRKVATAVLECLFGIAARREAWVIYVQADQADEPAIALYKRLGARRQVLHFEIRPPRATAG